MSAAFSIDSIIDSFVAKFTPDLIARLRPWMRPAARAIVAAFTALNLDAELKKLIDLWLNSDQSEPLPMFVMKRLQSEDRPEKVGIDPFTILTLVSLAIKLFNLLRQPAVRGTADGEAAETLTDEPAEVEKAFESALAEG